MAEQIQGVPADVTEDELPVQGVPAGLTEETLPKASVSAKSKVEGVPEGVTEEDLPNLQQKDAETLHNAWEGAKHYAGGLASSLGIPTSGEELKAAEEEHDITKHPVKMAGEMLGGPAVQVGEQLYGMGKRFVQGVKQTGKEALEAGANIDEGQPILSNLAKPVSEAVETGVRAIPFIGEPMAAAGEDVAAKQYARAAGELTGVVGQVAVPELHEELFPDKTLEFHKTKVLEAQKELETAKKAAAPYADSAKQGVAPPKDIQGPIDKAQAKFDEATFHRDTYIEEEAKRRAAATAKKQAAPAPEIPAEKIEAKPLPKLNRLGENTVSPAHATTTVPVEPTEAPKPRIGGRIELANEQGTMDKPLMLPEKATAGLTPLEEPKPEASKPAPVTDEAALRALEAKGGKVVTNPEKLAKLRLEEALKPEKGGLKLEEPPTRKPPLEQTPFAVTERANETIARDQNMPKHPAEGYTPKKEEVVPVGNIEETKNPVKSAAEYHPAVEQKVSELSDANLRTLAKAHGLNPDEYDFNVRDDHRHRVERNQLAKEITEQMGEDEKINIGRAAERSEGEGTFASKDTTSASKAERAAKMFPRLRGPVDEFGNPTQSGGSQSAEEGIGGLERWSGKNPLEKPSVRPQQERVNLPNEGKAQPFESTTPDWQEAVLEARKALNKGKETAPQDTPKYIANEHNANRGFTYNPQEGLVRDKAVFSVAGEHTDLDATFKGPKIKPEDVKAYMERPEVKAVLDADPQKSIGGWVYKGNSHLEISKIFHDRDAAIAEGKRLNQHEIYDHAKRENIPTGGTAAEELHQKAHPDFIMIKDAEGKPDRLEITNEGEPVGHLKVAEEVPGTWTVKDAVVKDPQKGIGTAAYLQLFDEARKAGVKAVESDISTTKGAANLWKSLQRNYPEAITEENGQFSADPNKVAGEPKAPEVGGASGAAGVGKAKVKTIAEMTPEDLQAKLPELAQKHLTEEEKEGVTTTATGKPRTAGTNKFISNMEKIPDIQQYIDIAQQGEGARKWYSRSAAAFDAMSKEAPDYFKKGDKEKFLGVLAGSSPQQAVVNNLRETLGLWKEWVDAGRPKLDIDKWKQFGEEADKAWKDDGSPRVRGLAKGASMHWDYAPTGPKWKTENLLLKNLTLTETKVPNIIKAINGENMWPDLTKNEAFKAPSFAENLRKWINGKSTGTNRVTNDSWMGLFGGIDKSALSKPENYHPLSVATRAAAEALGWEPEEAQAAIWSFTQSLTEKGVEDPEVVRHYSEDFHDLMVNDLEVRDKLKGLGVNLDDLDKRLDAVESKPKVSGRSTPTTAHSVGQLRGRIEEARGRDAIPAPKSIQGNLFRENPNFEHRTNREPGAGHETQPRDEATRFNPADFENETAGLTKLGEKKKKTPFGKIVP